MKKRYLVVPAAMILLAGICLSEGELPEGFEKNKIYRTCRGFISKLNERQYHSCYQLFTASMQQAMSEEKLCATLDAVLGSLGDFVRFKGVSAAPKKMLGEDYVVCTIKCIYENGPATFTISVDRDLKVGGLYIK